MSISQNVPRPQRTARRRRLTTSVASVAFVAALASACSSSSDTVPATTLDGSVATTLSPEAEGPQVGLEPGSNMPPDVDSTDQSNDDNVGGDMVPATSTSEATGGG